MLQQMGGKVRVDEYFFSEVGKENIRGVQYLKNAKRIQSAPLR